MRVEVTGPVFRCLAALAVIGCGDDGGGKEQDVDGAMMEEAAPAGGGSCNKGEYPGDHGTLELCGKGGECNSVQVPLEKLRGYTSYRWDINLIVNEETDLSALSCLESVGGFTLGRGTELKDLSGLGKLKKASSIVVLRMNKLTSLAGLDSLQKTNQVTVNFNPALTDLTGLPAGFETLRLYVGSNDNLTSLDGLANVKVTDRILFENNEMLSDCAIEAFAGRYPDAESDWSGNLEAECP